MSSFNMLRFAAFALLSAEATVFAQSGSEILKFVDPLIGTSNGGHVFAGATLPFGMAKASPDSVNDNEGGYASDGGQISGFSHMHDDGTGGSPSLGNFPIFPYAGCANDTIDNCDFPISTRPEYVYNNTVIATPGYFSVKMVSGIRAEMTVSNRTALYRFTFPQNPLVHNATLRPLILADLTDLPLSRSKGAISVDETTGRIVGNGTFSPSFGIGTYDLNFCADFSGADIRDTGVFMNNRAGSQPKHLQTTADGVNNSPEILPAGAWTQFNAPNSNNQILVRVGVSFISVDQACSNAQNEIPDYDFDGVHQSAVDAWTNQLGAIEVKPGNGTNSKFQKIFWSGVYRTNISPQNYTGENYLWNSTEPYYDSYYCIWDSFRSIHSLITILDPYSQIHMMRSLVDIWRHEGWMPDCRMSLCKGFTQGGSNADILLSDLFTKMRQLATANGLDWEDAYQAVLTDAEKEPPDWSVNGRGGLASWKSLNYIPTEDYDPYGVGPFTRSISRTVEYAYDDFCIAQMAHGLGKAADAQVYSEQSTYWANMFKADQKSYNYTGFLQPKFLNQTWGYQNPIFCSPLLNFTSCYLNPDGHETYEGSAWLYTFFVPQDMATLITKLGGNTAFVNRLDYFHTSGLLYVGDEQGFLPVFQYHFAGRPAKSAERIHYYIPSQFNTSVTGIAGNDDSGAMGSFVALSMMGSFPNPGQDVYFITPPFFEEVSVTNKLTGKKATIRNINFDPSYKNIYIQKATMDGKPYYKNWFSHDFYLNGGLLELTLGANESSWGTRPQDLPPSLSTSHNSTGYTAQYSMSSL